MSMLALFNASSPMYGFSVPKASECSSTATFNCCFASSLSTSLRFSSSAALMLKYCVLRPPPAPPPPPPPSRPLPRPPRHLAILPALLDVFAQPVRLRGPRPPRPPPPPPVPRCRGGSRRHARGRLCGPGGRRRCRTRPARAPAPLLHRTRWTPRESTPIWASLPARVCCLAWRYNSPPMKSHLWIGIGLIAGIVVGIAAYC